MRVPPQFPEPIVEKSRFYGFVTTASRRGNKEPDTVRFSSDLETALGSLEKGFVSVVCGFSAGEFSGLLVTGSSGDCSFANPAALPVMLVWSCANTTRPREQQRRLRRTKFC